MEAKMASKAQKLKKKKAAKAKAHPMSAVGPTTGPGRPMTRHVETCGPTRELLAQLAAHGPTDMIERALARGIITQEGAQGLSTFASIRRLIGVAEYRPQGVLASMVPSAMSAMTPDERRQWAMERYREIAARILALKRGDDALDAVQSACDNRAPRDWEALAAGARVLGKWFVDGVS
jgi:hypothetical protein